MGPWSHGQWSSGDGSKLGHIHFGAKTAAHFQKNMELTFFNHFLKGKGEHGLAEANVFETGANRWRKFDHWPPKNTVAKTLFVRGGGKLSHEGPPDDADVFDEFISDPARPVPFTEAITTGMAIEYMTDDQRFAAKRPDVAVYETEVLKDDLTLAGPIRAELHVATSGSDSDWIVKLIDVFPTDAKDNPAGKKMGGYQMMVRSEIIRGRYRNSYEKPEAFEPNQPTKVNLELLDVLHTFKKGHRVMVQISSTWFPLADRNPQKFVPNIFLADESDFVRTTQSIYRSRSRATALYVGVLPKGAE
jgi:putative CocE/NonD family hydrolase